jgi:hypothetical protein
MCLNQPVPTANLTIDGQQIAIVEEFKYLGAYMASSEKDIKVRIGLAWSAFAKIKSILISSKPSISFKMRLFSAACISILLYGCESWILTAALADKLDIFARKCYRVILGICQKDDHVRNEDLYKRAGQAPISEQIRHRQLKFTGHCLRMPDTEPANNYALFESNIGTRHVGKPKMTYLRQISQYLCADKTIQLTAKDITEKAKNKTEWNKHFAVPKKRKPPDPSTQPAR